MADTFLLPSTLPMHFPKSILIPKPLASLMIGLSEEALASSTTGISMPLRFSSITVL